MNKYGIICLYVANGRGQSPFIFAGNNATVISKISRFYSRELSFRGCSTSFQLCRMFPLYYSPHDSSATMCIALTFPGNFFPIYIFDTPPKTSLIISHCPLYDIRVPMDPTKFSNECILQSHRTRNKNYSL